MKRTQWLPILLFSGFLAGVSACKTEVEKGVVGKWEAAQLKECDDIVPIQTALVGLELFSNGTYVFNSTLNVREEGTYRIKKNYLYRLDRKAKNGAEKAVFIQSLSLDTMVLAMNFKGKDQWLTLVREGAAERQAKREMAAEAEQLKKDSLAMAAEMAQNGTAKTAQDTPSVNSANLAAVSTPVANAASAAAAVAVAKSVSDVKKEETKPLTENEAYQKREAKRKEEEATRKKEREAYLKREAKRKEEAADRERERKKEREAYLKREAKRKKEAAEKKKKKKK